jgi:protein tyrosine/serine phosphatase
LGAAAARVDAWLGLAAAAIAVIASSGCAAAAHQSGTGTVALSSPLQPQPAGLPNFGEVKAGVLYRGGLPIVDRSEGLDGYRELIQKYKIRTIVDLMNEPIDHWIAGRHSDCKRMTPDQKRAIKYVHLPSLEPTPSRQTLTTLLRVLKNADNRPVFVHCADGENRTGALVGGYRVVEDRWQPVDAEAEMTNFHVLGLWKGVNERFIEGVAREREAIEKEVASPADAGEQVLNCNN